MRDRCVTVIFLVRRMRPYLVQYNLMMTNGGDKRFSKVGKFRLEATIS